MKKILYSTIILFAISLIPVQANWTMPQANSTININDGYDDQIEFAASNEYIVYTNYSPDTFSLYLYSITTGEAQLLAEQTEDKFKPAIDGNDVVWMVAENGKRYINHYQIDLDENTVYVMPISSYHDTHPFIHNNKITFTRWNLNNGSSYAMLYDIATNALTYTDGLSGARQTNQKHFDNIIVWQDQRNDIDEIFIQEEVADEKIVRNLSNNGLSHYFPKIYGRNVIWDTRNTIYVKNLDDQTLQIIGSDQYANFYSSIHGNNVVYQSKRNGSYDIYLYNLKTKSEVKITNSYQNDESPSINKNIITWRRQNSNDRYDVHYINIKPALEKLYTELSFVPITSSEVTISWPSNEDASYVGAMLYRSNTSADQGTLISDHLANYIFNDTNLIPGNNYYYSLALIDQNGYESPQSKQYKYTASNKKLVKITNSPTVYLIDENDSYIISNEDIFNSHGFRWSDITTITTTNLDQYHYNGPLKYPSGTLIQTDHNTAYLIYDDVARPFADSEIFIRAGYDWSKIKKISQALLNTYQIEEVLTMENFSHPNGTLIKYTYNPNIYFIENNTKRLIIDENAFHEHSFDWANVLTIPVYWEYPIGQNL